MACVSPSIPVSSKSLALDLDDIAPLVYVVAVFRASYVIDNPCDVHTEFVTAACLKRSVKTQFYEGSSYNEHMVIV